MYLKFRILFLLILSLELSGIVFGTNLSSPANISAITPQAYTRVKEQLEKVNVLRCEQSYYSEEDIKWLTNYLLVASNINKTINDIIQLELLPMRNKHLQCIQNFNQWFEGQPDHMRNVLKDMSNTRKDMEDSVFKFKNSLKEYPEFVLIYQKKETKAQALLEKLEKQKKICKHNCDSFEVVVLSGDIQLGAFNRYCGSLSKIFSIISQQLKKFVNGYSLRIRKGISEMDRTYAYKIQNIINTLKDLSVKQFGHTMNNILKLQDEYRLLINDFLKFRDKSWLEVIKELNVEIDSLLMKFDTILNNYEVYCQSCDRYNLRRKSTEKRQNDEEHESIIDFIVHSKTVEIYNNSEVKIASLLKELNEQIDNVDLKALNISHFEPVQKELIEMTNVEIDAFNKLNSYIAKDLELVNKLVVNVQELKDKIFKEYHELQNRIKELKY